MSRYTKDVDHQLSEIVRLYYDDIRKALLAHGADVGFSAMLAAAVQRAAIVGANNALEIAARACEESQSGHGKRADGSDGPDAARRNCAILIRDLKTPPSERDV